MTQYPVTINKLSWTKHGGKMMKWVHEHISEDCYKLKFGRYMVEDPVTIVFETSEQAVFFKLGTLTWNEE